MITTLHIKNIGIIDDLNIDLNQGLNVLTGETGAGKTLIIDALSIVAGGRFSKEMIRKGENHSFVEIALYLPESEDSIDGNIIISREIYSNGRNLCKINGRLVTVNELKNFMNNILNIHGQNDNQNLLNKENHIEYLDSFIGEKIQKDKVKYEKLYQRDLEIRKILKNNYGDEKEKQRRIDLLQYQRKEIEEAKLKKGEEIELEGQRRRMLNSEKLVENLKEADFQINDISLEAIGKAIRNFERIENLDKEYEKVLNSLKGIYYDLQELGRDITSYEEDITFDESEREETEKRLDLISDLKRKYGNTIEEILDYKEIVEKEIEKIENLEEYNNNLKQEKNHIEEEMKQISNTINDIRKEYAINLSNQINREIKELEMKNAEFTILVEKVDEFNKNGQNRVEFLISTNEGEDKKSLIKIASGGEMSRIMLAIKTVLSNVDQVSCLVFDEIDTGISGKAAKAVGEKLKKISKYHQVLIVTHLASIAAKGEYNYYIYKENAEGKTKTKVVLLQGEAVLKEIARISTGEVTEISMRHAMELRE